MNEVRGGSRAAIVNSNTTSQLKTGAGTLGAFIVADAGSGWTVSVYDNASANSNLIYEWTSGDGKVAHQLGIPCQNGIRVVSSGTTAGSVTIVYE